MDQSDTLRPGRYRHFKGGEYEIIGVATHSETREPIVVYRPLYGEGGLWVRPLAMFTERVVREGIDQPRFVYIDEQGREDSRMEPCTITVEPHAGARIQETFADARAIATLANWPVLVRGNGVEVEVRPDMGEPACRIAYEAALARRDERGSGTTDRVVG